MPPFLIAADTAVALFLSLYLTTWLPLLVVVVVIVVDVVLLLLLLWSVWHENLGCAPLQDAHLCGRLQSLTSANDIIRVTCS